MSENNNMDNTTNLVEATNEGVVSRVIDTGSEIVNAVVETVLENVNESSNSDTDDTIDEAIEEDTVEDISSRRRVRILASRLNRYNSSDRDRLMSSYNYTSNNQDDLNYGRALNMISEEIENNTPNEVEEDVCFTKKECGICREQKDDIQMIVTPCKHTFCHSCFFNWLKRSTTCALCRAPLSELKNLTDREAEYELTYLQDSVRKMRQSLNNYKNKSSKIIKKEEETIKLLTNKRITLKNDIEYTLGYKQALLGKILKRADLNLNGYFKDGYLRGFWDTRNPEEAHGLYKELKCILFEKKEKFNKKV